MRRYATFVARGSIRYVGYIRLKDSSVPKQRIWICSRALSQYGPISSTTPTAATHSPSTTVSPALLSQSTSTIYALSSAPGRAGIAIIRISGTACLDVYHAFCPSKSEPKPRYATLRTLYDPLIPSNVLDSNALVLYFPAPATVTGEDVLELHIHGGPATVKAVLAAIPKSVSADFIRYAEPGEFTRRAFENNRLDLAQVEALSDTLSAETEQQRRAAVKGNSGALGRTYEAWRQQLLEARGELEAFIDFSEDQHFDESNGELLRNVENGVEAIQTSILIHEEASRRGELLRKGIRISMLGPPNVGKSSLLNRIVGREASIVSTEAGTTRDIVEVSLDIEGYLCTFADTAGLRSQILDNPKRQSSPFNNSIGAVEEEGIRRAKLKAKESDIVIALTSVEYNTFNNKWMIRYDPEVMEIAFQAQHFLVVVNKIDVVSKEELNDLLEDFRLSLTLNFPDRPVHNILAVCCWNMEAASSTDPGNIKNLVTTLAKCFRSMTDFEHEDLFGVTERQRQLLSQCKAHLDDYLAITRDQDVMSDEFDIVLAAEHLRSAANCLSRITGRGEAGDVEEVLGVVFEKFCVGK